MTKFPHITGKYPDRGCHLRRACKMARVEFGYILYIFTEIYNAETTLLGINKLLVFKFDS